MNVIIITSIIIILLLLLLLLLFSLLFYVNVENKLRVQSSFWGGNIEKINDAILPLTVLVKHSYLEVWLVSKYASVHC